MVCGDATPGVAMVGLNAFVPPKLPALIASVDMDPESTMLSAAFLVVIVPACAFLAASGATTLEMVN